MHEQFAVKTCTLANKVYDIYFEVNVSTWSKTAAQGIVIRFEKLVKWYILKD